MQLLYGKMPYNVNGFQIGEGKAKPSRCAAGVGFALGSALRVRYARQGVTRSRLRFQFARRSGVGLPFEDLHSSQNEVIEQD